MQNNLLSRRAWLRAAGGAAVLGAMPFTISKASAQSGGKPNSKVAGVQLGVTTYSYLSMPHKVDDVIQYPGVHGRQLHRASQCCGGGPRHPAGRAPVTTRRAAQRAGEGGFRQGRGIGPRSAAEVAPVASDGTLRSDAQEVRRCGHPGLHRQVRAVSVVGRGNRLRIRGREDTGFDWDHGRARAIRPASAWASSRRSTRAWQCSTLTARLQTPGSPSTSTSRIHRPTCSTWTPATTSVRLACIRTT